MTRLISGVLLAAAAVAAILFLPPLLLRVLAAVVAALAADEYLRVTGRRPSYAHWIVVAAVVYACWRISSIEPVGEVGRGDALPFAAVFRLVAGVVGWMAFSLLYSNRSIHDAATDLVAPAYVGLPLGMLVGVHQYASWRATLLLLGTIVVSDSAQYYTGRAFGRRPLAPTISPKKTVEGAIGGVIFGVAFMTAASFLALPPVAGIASRMLVGAVVVALGIIGDLFESRLKREAGVKDSSLLIPGHGGVLDRIDALLFATPAFYYALVRGLV
jgi:phosphatidate cytidylyltransferase